MSLREQLARFHAAITGVAPLDSARDLVVRGEVDELARLHVYEHAYLARIAGVLAHDYPKLSALVDLRALTPSFLQAHPPRDPSLREVGAPLPSFLREAHLADLARLERARTEVFDGPDAVPLTRGDLAALDPAEFPSLSLRFVPSSRVATLTTNADDLWDALELSATPPAAVVAQRMVLVWRREHVVIHRTLDADEAQAAAALAAGTTFGEVCELLGAEAERALELLVRWLDARCLRRHMHRSPDPEIR
jgi:hypothetical protein